jgi:signal transduction histidine kinase
MSRSRELVAKEQTARRDGQPIEDDFLAVSHELRTPLSAILGWSHMLKQQQLPPDRMRHGIDVIERNARAQRQLIEDLLDVSRIAANRLRLTREAVRLGDVVEAALDAVRPQAAAKGVEVETILSDRAPVLGDPRRLEQVVWNLAWNAVKFTPASGRVRVHLVRASHEAILSISDTGVGISSEFLPHVFEWFRQADAKSQSQSGLGLGLGIVRHLVQLHGGSVYAESAGEGRGATFSVRLPTSRRYARSPSQNACRSSTRQQPRTFIVSKTTMTRANCANDARKRGRWWKASRVPRALVARSSPTPRTCSSPTSACPRKTATR